MGSLMPVPDAMMSDLMRNVAISNAGMRLLEALEGVSNREEILARLEKDAEAKSPFKIFQLVRVCIHWGPHDNNDQEYHHDSRVIGWDFMGRAILAIPFDNLLPPNPHCYECSYRDDEVNPRDGQDWVGTSKFKVGMEITFEWELTGFGMGMGVRLLATIEAPHIKMGDWVISYPKEYGGRNNRVLNESQMSLPVLSISP